MIYGMSASFFGPPEHLAYSVNVRIRRNLAIMVDFVEKGCHNTYQTIPLLGGIFLITKKCLIRIQNSSFSVIFKNPKLAWHRRRRLQLVYNT